MRHHRDQKNAAENTGRRLRYLAGERTGPDIQQKEMMCQPTDKKAGGKIEEIEKDTAQLLNIKADELWQYCRYHRDRDGKDQSCLDIIPLYHACKILSFFHFQ